MAPDLAPVQSVHPSHPSHPSHPLYPRHPLSPADPDNQVTCPLLGIPDDPRSRFTFATPSHRCYAGLKAAPIDLVHQGAYCLAARYPECVRFRGGVEQDLHRGRRAVVGLVRALVFVAAVALIGYVGGRYFLGAFVGSGSGPAPGANGGGLVSPAPTGNATPSATGGAASAPASGAPGATSSPGPTPIATAQIHIVTRGETLSSIAAHYGVTVTAIQKANKIADPSHIVPGDRLVIPPPP